MNTNIHKHLWQKIVINVYTPKEIGSDRCSQIVFFNEIVNRKISSIFRSAEKFKFIKLNQFYLNTVSKVVIH